MDEILWFDHSNETSLAVLYMVLFTQCQYNPNWRVMVVVVVGGGGALLHCVVWKGFWDMVQIWDFRSNFKTGFFALKVAAIQWEEHHHPWPVLKELRLFFFRRMMSSQSLKNQRSSPQSDNQTKSLLIPVIGTQENQSSLSRYVKPCYTKYPTYYLLTS